MPGLETGSVLGLALAVAVLVLLAALSALRRARAGAARLDAELDAVTARCGRAETTAERVPGLEQRVDALTERLTEESRRA